MGSATRRRSTASAAPRARAGVRSWTSSTSSWNDSSRTCWRSGCGAARLRRVLQHVSLEVREQDVRACVAFWERLGVAEGTPPPALRRFTWVQRESTQIYLLPTERPAVPARGDAAVVVDDSEAA